MYDLFKINSFFSYLDLSKLLLSSISLNIVSIEDIRQFMLQTIVLEDQNQITKEIQVNIKTDWLDLWIFILSSQVPNDRNFCSLLNTLIHGMYFSQISFQKISQLLLLKNLKKKDILQLYSLKYHWICYTLLLGYFYFIKIIFLKF